MSSVKDFINIINIHTQNNYLRITQIVVLRRIPTHSISSRRFERDDCFNRYTNGFEFYKYVISIERLDKRKDVL